MLRLIGWNVMRQICGQNVFQLISLQEWSARDSHADAALKKKQNARRRQDWTSSSSRFQQMWACVSVWGTQVCDFRYSAPGAFFLRIFLSNALFVFSPPNLWCAHTHLHLMFCPAVGQHECCYQPIVSGLLFFPLRRLFVSFSRIHSLREKGTKRRNWGNWTC